jgi:hypothetical protein
MKSKTWPSGRITCYSCENYAKKLLANFSKQIVRLHRKCPPYKIGKILLASKYHKIELYKPVPRTEKISLKRYPGVP